MKFKDKDGNVFVSIKAANTLFCEDHSCFACPLDENVNRTTQPCEAYILARPAEAARLMGYEVVEGEKETVAKNTTVGDGKDANMDKQSTASQVKSEGQSSKPFKDWTLGEIQANCNSQHCSSCLFNVDNSKMCGATLCIPAKWDLTDPPSSPASTSNFPTS